MLATSLSSRGRRAPRNRPRPRLFIGLVVTVVAVLLFLGSAVLAATLHHVAQKNRSFAIGSITIAVGDSIAFGNDDEFLHQIYIDSAKMDFDSAEQHRGEMITVKFPIAGTFPVRCRIHPKMLLVVTVQ